MGDNVAIASELPFPQQVSEYASFLSRSLTSSDSTSPRDFVASFESQVGEGSDVERKKTAEGLVDKTVELKGGLSERSSEAESESAYLLLHHMIETTFEPSSSEYGSALSRVVDAISEAGLALAKARSHRPDVACRILTNIYNSLASTSALRPTTLLGLLRVLGAIDELSSLPLSESYLTAQLAQWSNSPAEKADFLIQACNIYAKSRDTSTGLSLAMLAISQNPSAAEMAVVLSVADEKKFTLDDVLGREGVKESLSGPLGELAGLFSDVEELEAVQKGQAFVASHADWIAERQLRAFTGDTIMRKLRLIALVTLCVRSETQELRYEDVVNALLVDISAVEEWVIDAIQCDLICARLSQPSSLVRVTSVSVPSMRHFGAPQWQVLAKKLSEWRDTVAQAREAISEAEAVAAQPVNSGRRRGGGAGDAGPTEIAA